jgi:pimeloyl-ACP methyl ester carboxylesterase
MSEAANPSGRLAGSVLRRLNGTDLDVVDDGAGVAVVFSHGGASDLRYWERQREPFAARYRFVAYSQRGRGGSAEPAGGIDSAETNALDLVALLRSLGPDRAHLVGFSSVVALRAALLAPDLLRSLTVIEPNAPWLLDGTDDGAAVLAGWRAANEALREAGVADPEGRAGRWFELVNNEGPGTFEQQPEAFQEMWLENFGRPAPSPTLAPPITCADLAALDVPTLVLGAEHGMAYSRRIAALVAGCIPGSTLVVVPRVTHFMSYQDPERFNAVALEFMERH